MFYVRSHGVRVSGYVRLFCLFLNGIGGVMGRGGRNLVIRANLCTYWNVNGLSVKVNILFVLQCKGFVG